MKRQRLDAPSPTPTVTSATPLKTEQPQPSRKQGASKFMQEFSDEFETLQADILSTFHHPHLGQLCLCQNTDPGRPAVYRCTQCFQPHLLCQDCIVDGHVHNPFHFIEFWNGLFFQRTTLMDLGLIVSLGHYGQKCPNSVSTGRHTAVVDTHGIQWASIRYCHCQERSNVQQLVQAQLFPATIKHPETVFTFAVLKHFHLSNLTSKKSAYDYCAALKCLTDSALPDAVPDRYREMQRVSRVWNHLSMVRRSGEAHNINTVLSHRQKGSLTVRCPACPELGFNVDQSVVDAAKDSETHKYTLFLSVDGNFRLQRKAKNDDPDDIALNNGKAYFVPTEAYNNYCQAVQETVPEKSASCSHLRAAKMQNIVKFKNAAVSGVVAVQCARHGFYMSQGVVDMVKGETFGTWFKSLVDVISRIRGAIPKMHVANHVESCMLLYGFNYLPYSGETWGENIEGGWAEQNQSAGSTKEMNDGHRHDALDDLFGFWNWTKLHHMSATLDRMYRACIKTLIIREGNFTLLTEMQPREVISEWEAMDIQPRKVNGIMYSVYEAHTGEGGPPTMKNTLETLMENNLDKEGTSLICLLNAGIALEQRQFALRLKEDSHSQLGQKLATDIEDWRRKQLLRFPSLENRLPALKKEIKVEDFDLLLPSSISPDDWDDLGLSEMATIEYKLREGQAHDALADLRIAVKTYNANVNFKKENVFGQGPNTRAQKLLNTLQSEKIIAMKRYNLAYTKLLALGLSSSDAKLQPLNETMLWVKNVTQRHQLGSSKIVDPWYWHTGRPAGQTEDTWSLEMDRVKWFRDRAARDRSREEKELLKEEFRRTVLSFKRMAEVWDSISSCQSPGSSAYAAKRSAMYYKLQTITQTTFDKAEKFSETYTDIKEVGDKPT
ncbi:hypothetical protein H0H93_005915 [Arthromyces matolae]|nr:hypothetical protein H0H93_005915 [Arthromyces matolae]